MVLETLANLLAACVMPNPAAENSLALSVTILVNSVKPILALLAVSRISSIPPAKVAPAVDIFLYDATVLVISVPRTSTTSFNTPAIASAEPSSISRTAAGAPLANTDITSPTKDAPAAATSIPPFNASIEVSMPSVVVCNDLTVASTPSYTDPIARLKLFAASFTAPPCFFRFSCSAPCLSASFFNASRSRFALL